MASVTRERRDQLVYVTIDRPLHNNSLNTEVLRALCSCIRDSTSDPAIKAIILTGAGTKAFCAGGDIKEAAEDPSGVFDSDCDKHPMVELFHAVEECGKPLIARVNGHVFGGGLGLLCMCDLAVAVDYALIGVPEVRIGVFPLIILGYMLRMVPRRKLLELALTGQPVSAAEATTIGLINRAVPAEELDKAVDDLTKRVLAGSPSAIRLGKYAFRAMQDMSLRECFDYAQLMIARISRTPEAIEGIEAFIEKRKPRWD